MASCSQAAEGGTATGVEAEQSAVEAPASRTGTVWKGTLGNQPVTACFEEEHIRDGAYYYDKYLIPLRLVEMADAEEAPLVLTEVEGFSEVSGATWTMDRKSATRLDATWRNGNRSLPIRLEAVPVELSEYGSACETDAFLNPLLAGGSIFDRRLQFEGLAYTERTYEGPGRLGFDEYRVTVLALDPEQPGDAAINRALAKALPTGSAADSMGQCVGMSLLTGQLGYLEEALSPMFVSDGWLGIQRSGTGYCGGAHPGHFWTLAVYNRTSGKEVDPSVWFTPDALEFYEFEGERPDQAKRPVAALSPGLAKRVAARWRSDDGEDNCADIATRQSGWEIGLAPGGVVFVPQLPYVIFACTTNVVVPWEELTPYLSDEGRRVRALASQIALARERT